MNGEGDSISLHTDANGIIKQGRFMPVEMRSHSTIRGRESRLDMVYDHDRGTVEYHSVMHTFFLGRRRQVDDTLKLPSDRRVDDLLSAELNFAANVLEQDPDGTYRTFIVRRARPEDEGPDDVSASGYHAELIPLRFQAVPEGASGRLRALIDITSFSSWARRNQPGPRHVRPRPAPREREDQADPGHHLQGARHGRRLTPSPMGHDLVGLGEVMLRLAAPPPQRLDQAVALDVQIGGSEANVLAAVSRLGLRTAFISALPAEHAWGDRTVRELSGHGVDCAGVLRRPGSRMGLYFLEYGVPPRPVRVLYDRRDSAMSQLVPEEVDWAIVRGARMVHLSGITAALGDSLRAVIRRACREAQSAGVPVSFDVNYRSRLWSAKEARDFLSEVLPAVRYLFIGSDDAETVFELSGEPEKVLRGLARLAPAATIALTLGEAGSAVLAAGAVLRPSRLYTVTTVDRVGAGDAYAAGFLWRVLQGRSVQEAVDAATALAALKCTIWGDIALVRPPELEELMASANSEIRR